MSHFIQNTGDNSRSQISNNLLPSKTKAMDFLVGYFYFSGIQEIYKNIDDKPMRILVGMDMDHELLNKTSEFDFFAQNHRPSSNKDIRDNFYDSLINLFNQTNYFENEEEAEAFRLYYDKIKKGELEVRKTQDPTHAKMYIFAYKDEFTEGGETPGTVITGSSNFTYSGLRSNQEINVRFHSKDEFHDAKNIFNSLWEMATVIIDKDHIKDFEEGVMKHIWYEKTPSPYLLYLRVLYEYFKLNEDKHVLTPAEITHGEFLDLKYQSDAVRIAIDTIERHNGAIIADVVGLGKSIIGATVARNLNLRTLVICPPHLTQQWNDYTFEFEVHARVYSRGNMEKVLNEYKQIRREDETMLIIIDEAHVYRNEYIKDYAILHEICQNNKVLLLTATPFNNRPEDIYSMIKLFQIPTKSTLQTVENLGTEFSHLISTYKGLRKSQREGTISDADLSLSVKSIGASIRRIISPLVIRRSRLDLKRIPAYREDIAAQGVDFPVVNPPMEKTYRLKGLEGKYKETLERISPRQINLTSDYDGDGNVDPLESRIVLSEGQKAFQAARYKPIIYIKPEHVDTVKQLIDDAGIDYNLFRGSQRNLASFMRKLLVRRFESSQYAFKLSLESMLEGCLNIQKWIEKRNAVPVFKKGKLPDIEELYDSDADTFEELREATVEEAIAHLNSKGMFEIKSEYLMPEFFADLESDIQLLKDLKKVWDEVGEDNDPKLDGFITLLSDSLARDKERKIVVFSQFADTVEYLGKKLKEEGLPVFVYTSKAASPTNKEVIKLNFDAGIAQQNQKDDYQILIATDAISEGYNLHRAGTIYNYDIPYNPTRVIQRVGRINRINKKVFKELYIYNYFPTHIGEAETSVKEISTLKMAMIHAIMGEDTKYLTNDEELQNYFEKQYKELFDNEEDESWDTTYRALLDNLMNTNEMAEALKLPLRSKVRRLSTVHPNGVIAFARKNGDYVFKFVKSADEQETLDPSMAFEIIKAEPDEKGYQLSKDFNKLFDKAKHSLFVQETESEKDKTKRDALDKIRLIIKQQSCDLEYLEELQKAIELDAIAGYSLRQINRLRKKDFPSLPDIISRDYVESVLHNFDNISHGVETLIMAEEIDNKHESSTSEQA